MRDRALLLGLAVLGLIAGCQQSPAPQGAASTPQLSAAAIARGEADLLMERGEYAKAAGKYQETVALDPDDMALRFALGSAYSRLGRRAEAAEQFQWVVTRGAPGGDDYRAARRWLVSAGLLSDGQVAPGASDSAATDQAQQPTRGKVAGSLEWPGVNPRQHLIKVRMTLTGDDEGTRTVSLSRPFRLGERYEFRDLAPGKYRLVARAEDGAPAVELWNQQVRIEAGQVTQLPLSPANSPVASAAFPGGTR